MANNQNLEYNLPQNSYAAFDAVTLKDFIIQRLNENDQFTDQNYEGSNLAAFIDIIAYSYHVLLFYLNQTSSETLFSQSSIYENMNRIVQLLGYKPTGKQTSLCPIKCVADSNLNVGSYILKKYSYFLIDNIQYTVIEDFPFEKTTSEQENIDSIEQNLILYQGTVNEYPIYVAEGNSYETISVVVDNLVDESDTRFIANNTISVYVKEQETDTWFEYEEVDNLFLADPDSRSYDLRLNENGHYEIKFGNGTFGKKLKNNDEVAIYYILSDGQSGIISRNSINGNKLFTFNTSQFGEIYSNINTSNNTPIDLSNNSLLTFSNPLNSTVNQEAETVEQIRENAPLIFSSQLRLVTETDYESYIQKSIPNVLNSVKVVNNKNFINQYIDYFYRICVDPNKVNRVILNQVNFADSCDFNNINIFCCPSFSILEDESYPDFLSNSFKQLIIDLTRDRKMINSEIVPRDPIYMAYDLGFTNRELDVDVYNDTKLIITKNNNSKISNENLKTGVQNQIIEFFKAENNELGETLDITSLTSSILSLQGVQSIRTENTRENIFFNGISFLSWNPLYEDSDINLVNQSETLPFFKFPYFYRPNNLLNKIEIVNE